MSGALTTILLSIISIDYYRNFYATNKNQSSNVSLTQVQMTCLNVQKPAGLKP